jgi:hypothetical protein
MDAGTPQPEGIQASLLFGARPRKLITRATAMRTHLVGGANLGFGELTRVFSYIDTLHQRDLYIFINLQNVIIYSISDCQVYPQPRRARGDEARALITFKGLTR